MLLIGMVGFNPQHHLNRCVLKTAQEARFNSKRFVCGSCYGSGGGGLTLRLSVQRGRLRAKIRYSVCRINALTLRLLNSNTVEQMGASRRNFRRIPAMNCPLQH